MITNKMQNILVAIGLIIVLHISTINTIAIFNSDLNKLACYILFAIFSVILPLVLTYIVIQFKKSFSIISADSVLDLMKIMIKRMVFIMGIFSIYDLLILLAPSLDSYRVLVFCILTLMCCFYFGRNLNDYGIKPFLANNKAIKVTQLKINYENKEVGTTKEGKTLNDIYPLPSNGYSQENANLNAFPLLIEDQFIDTNSSLDNDNININPASGQAMDGGIGGVDAQGDSFGMRD